ncbi:hypothetical protein ScPMuIL_002300, partial [Solemya velum]
AIGSDLALQGMLVKYATTDGDARSAEGIKDAQKMLNPMWEVERLADPTHLGQSQFKKCINAKFSSDMFSGATREKKREGQKVLSQDVKARCGLIMKKLMTEHAGDTSIIKNHLPKVLEATILCYSGDCSKCSRNSVVCAGGLTN